MKQGKFRILNDGQLAFWCKGCNRYHSEEVEHKCNMCHLFITDGNIQYLSDCTHSLAGQTIELEEDEG